MTVIPTIDLPTADTITATDAAASNLAAPNLGAPNLAAPGPLLALDAPLVRESFNRQPFGFTHRLYELDIFDLANLRALASRYVGHERDYFVTAGAAAPGQVFRSVSGPRLGVVEAIDQLERRSVRVLLKRPENYDPRFGRLVDELFNEVLKTLGGLGDDKILRLESSIFLTSSATVTPFHFDPSVGFFSQIRGRKLYHVYPPAELAEPELEQFYFRGLIDIGQVDLTRRQASNEHVFNLTPGRGFHQPQNAPHWVETGEDVSISYTFVFETRSNRRLGRTRGFNHYLRRAGVVPAAPGVHPHVDRLKAGTLSAWVPCRKALSRIKATARGH